MPVSRMRMRPWLEQQIESNSIPGLDWVDKEKTMFSIPWKHAARHGWELDKDASLFKKWAIHTGKYVEGQSSDPKTWKANFRCALNSLPDIEEVKDKSISKGHQAVRIFRMLPSTPKSRDKRSKAKETRMRKKSSVVKMEKDTDDSSDAQSFTDESVMEDALSPQSSTVDSTVNTEMPDFAFADVSEVPDLCSSVEIPSKGFLDNLVSRFEVSPDHSLEYNSDEDIITLCQQLEQDSCWMLGSLDSLGFPINEECASPWSRGSESSDDLDHMPQYTTLGSGSTRFQDCWGSFHQNQPCSL